LSERPHLFFAESDESGQGPKQLPTDLLQPVRTIADLLAQLRAHAIEGVWFDAHTSFSSDRLIDLLQADSVLGTLAEGVAVVNQDLRIVWANNTFEKWCGQDVNGQGFYEAIGSPEILGPDYSPFHTALMGKPSTTRLHHRVCATGIDGVTDGAAAAFPAGRHLEVSLNPIIDSNGKVTQIIASCRDVTALVQQQQKLDALHQAGRELAALDTDALAHMAADDRIELLKTNIRRFTRDLLNYDVIEIRLLDLQTGKLEPLLAEGMTPEAAARVLYANQEGNGVTGFVAATGKSYICSDTANDPLYIEGARGARSSLTVALTWGDRVIGTFNVESPRKDGFGDLDLQFAEIFCREVATALHTLELLTAEQRSAASQSIDAVNREVVLPVDEILAAATAVLDRWIGHEPEMADKLKTILTNARAIKECIQKVGEGLVPPVKSSTANVANPMLKGLRILVADSDERVRRSAHSILGRFGCTVETARDGREALTMAKLCDYDAILADIRLPDVSGYDAYRKLREAQPEARVILMTAYGYDPSHAIVKARQDGLSFVLFKPFRVDQLLDALQVPLPATQATA